jgi:hypothetical protein
MSRSLHPPCAGSAVYGPHSAKVPAAYTVISPGGRVWYACDTDCLRRQFDILESEASWAARTEPLETVQRRRAAR